MLNEAESNFDKLTRQSKEEATRLRERLEEMTQAKKNVENSSTKKIEVLTIKLADVQKQLEAEKISLQQQLDSLRS